MILVHVVSLLFHESAVVNVPTCERSKIGRNNWITLAELFVLGSVFVQVYCSLLQTPIVSI